MQRLLSLSALALCITTSTALAQFSVVIPNGTATTEGNTSNAFPWGRGGTGLLHQGIYDASNFSLQGVTFPILITGLRWRPNTNVALVASSYTAGCSVYLSTAPAGSGVAPSATLATNRGGDYAQVFTGPVSWNAQPAQVGPTPFGIDIPLSSSFLYDPSGGDLNIECDLPIQTFTGTGPQLDVQSTGSLSSRVYVSTGYPGTGTGSIGTNHGVVVEVLYSPANGLYANFSSNITAGPVPTTVNFTDTTFTSAPSGVQTWSWDLDGDTTIDSTVQNPSFTYGACGAYDVTLTVTDGTNPTSTITKTGYIQVGITPITPSFTFAPLAPGVYQFTDTSTPAPASWAWDFDGDGTTDSTAQNPVYGYPACTANANVTLGVSSTCAGPWTTSQSIQLLPPIVPSFTFASIAPGVFQFTDTSAPTPTSWDWDLDGDGTTDSTMQNPVWPYTAPCTAVNVTLSVSDACQGPFTISEAIVLSPLAFTTTLAPNNGLSANGAGNQFNIDVTNPKGVAICALTLTPYTTTLGNPITCEVWVSDAPGGFAANTSNQAVWRLVATGQGTDQGVAGAPTPFALNNTLYLPSGQYAMGISTSQGLRYRTEPANPTVYAGPDFTITTGYGKSPLFGTGFNNPRGICATFHYSTFNNGDVAGYGYFGAGCAGSMGISDLSASASPVLGATMTVAVNNLPVNAGLMMTGFSKSTSPLGALPLDVSGFGAPGCFLRVSPDANLLILGSGNSANWSLTVPVNAGLVGVLMFQQAIALDPGFNAAGAVASDAHGLMLGL